MFRRAIHNCCSTRKFHNYNVKAHAKDMTSLYIKRYKGPQNR